MLKWPEMSNMLPKSDERPNVLEHVSENVRRLRRAAGLSQEALASAAGVSRRMLVGIEGGDVNVSLATLDRIAAALGVLFPDLVQRPDRPDRSRIDVVAWVGERPGSRATLLASSATRHEVELWSWSLAPGERYTAEPDAEGWREMIYVIEGRLSVYRGDLMQAVEAGDFLVFGSDQPYTYANEGEALLRFVRNVLT
ncbi:Transcriptional regulator, Cro/CI family [Metapseudomonas furukawaii]|jgi:transcriptional regulator with XRE-family HTH domain|uniref:Transcriptional regulator n=2 Tax=Metapseudomonas furukawaii TaxID=1149133 RepID=A0AAD1FFL6_METFU|nr:Transcriptional regulator, Cro/CI family [Pseudomonas furukawaii]OWJ89396.1 Cro/Cl family transcriptional regulator [Pseudomonas sp. A46]BAU74292.1 transcriptional regulator [Pseudomonas furukawaii]